MLINCNIQKLKNVMNCFFEITGVCCSLVNVDFTYRYRTINPNADYCRCIEQNQEGFCSCRASEKMLLERCRDSGQPELHICHAGLIDAAAPVIYNGSVLGYVILGQIRQDRDFSEIAARLEGFPVDLTEMEQYYKQLPTFNNEHILSIVVLAVLLARSVILENTVMPSVVRNMATVLEYIEQNLAEPLSIKSIAKNTNISPSTLYRCFRQNFHCTVSEYITDRRLAHSLIYLHGSSLSIEEIAQRVGFSSASHYSRYFKSKNGRSPLQDRKQYQK